MIFGFTYICVEDKRCTGALMRLYTITNHLTVLKPRCTASPLELFGSKNDASISPPLLNPMMEKHLISCYKAFMDKNNNNTFYKVYKQS